jgi:hypothetical protein
MKISKREKKEYFIFAELSLTLEHYTVGKTTQIT